MDFVLGKDGKLYQGAADAVLDTLTELSIVKDVTITMEASEADVSIRGGGGYKGTAQSLKDITIEFEMQHKSGDTGFEAIKTAYLNGTLVALAGLTGAKDVVGSEGPRGNFSITGFTRGEPLENAMTYNVTAKLTKFLAWEKKAA